jgi:hypothetical protein
MLHKIACAGILGLLALCVGCTMCCHPYDYNGPVYDDSGQCVSNVRAGSILDGEGMETMSSDVNQGNINPGNIKETTPNVKQGSTKAEGSEGATKILSVTDRKVEPSETVTNGRSSDDQSYPSLAQPATAKRR